MTDSAPRQVLEAFYHQAAQEGFNRHAMLNAEQYEWIVRITTAAESHKAVVTVLMTSLTKKIVTPEQDVRYHKVELPNGYSGRGFDTLHITPFIHSKFARLAMAESGWLTRSLEQVAPFTLDFPGKIRSAAVKSAFLNILHDLEVNKADPQAYLLVLLHELQRVFQRVIPLSVSSLSIQSLTIAQIVAALHNHFFSIYDIRGASRLPVIAVYSAYALLMESPRYRHMRLLPLKSHTTADTKAHSIGDIEIVREDNSFFEAIEIKHGKAITPAMLENATDKMQGLSVSRYYILTTAEPNTREEDRSAVQNWIDAVVAQTGCEMVVNGIMPSLKYYLRLLPDLNLFLQQYSANLQADYELNTDLKWAHIQRWQEILASLDAQT